MHNIRYTDIGESDYDERIAHYESVEPGLGDRFRRFLNQRLDQIAIHPRSVAIHEGHTRVTTMSKFPELIYYRIRKDSILIQAIIHKSRHSDAWKRRRR